jgi:rhomboid family GlyGly-CTERM serine protease|tara:strand:- start:36002 stop:36613 length:612 start_codon:yes stop_codon:yes gene_type:complete
MPMAVADLKLKWHVLAMVVLMLGLGLAHEWVNPWLRYDREAVAAGQVWRLLTCHLVHLNLSHMAMNLAGFLLCCFFFNDLLTRKILWLWLLPSSIAVGCAFYFIDDGLSWYVGLSGILHGLFIVCLLLGWRGNPGLHSVVMVLIVGRLIWEQMPGYDVDYLRTVINGRVYVNAHLYGSIAGAITGVGICLQHALQQKRKKAVV